MYWLHQAGAEQGDADAQTKVGVMYHEGWGAPQDYAEAVKWYRMAANRATPQPRTTLDICTSMDWACRRIMFWPIFGSVLPSRFHQPTRTSNS